jgi:hypothetical protein
MYRTRMDFQLVRLTLARKIIGLKPMRFSTGNHGALASLRWKPVLFINFNETAEMIEFMEHVLAF